MGGLFADWHHALRLYGRTPGPSVIVIIVLAVGTAFVGAFLSLSVDFVLKPFPGFEDSGRIVTIGQGDGKAFTGIPVDLIERISAGVTSVEAASGVESVLMPVGIGSDRVPTKFEMVTSGFFDGIRPMIALGRGFDRADHDPEAEPVVVISDRLFGSPSYEQIRATANLRIRA